MEAGAFLSPRHLDPGATEGTGGGGGGGAGGGPLALRGGGDGRLPVLCELQTCLQDTPGPRHCTPLQDITMKGYYSQ